MRDGRSSLPPLCCQGSAGPGDPKGTPKQAEAMRSGSERAHCRKRAVPVPGAGASRRELMRSRGSGRRVPPAQPLSPWLLLLGDGCQRAAPNYSRFPGLAKAGSLGWLTSVSCHRVQNPSNSRPWGKMHCSGAGGPGMQSPRSSAGEGRASNNPPPPPLPFPFLKRTNSADIQQHPGDRAALVQLYSGWRCPWMLNCLVFPCLVHVGAPWMLERQPGPPAVPKLKMGGSPATAEGVLRS